MQTRTRQSIVRFSAPFALKSIEETVPAGDYEVDHDEELIEGASWLAYRRVATFIHLPAISSNSLTSQLVPIDASELEAATPLDGEKSS